MKKIALSGFLAVFVLAGLAYAQKDNTKTISPEIKAEIEGLLSKAESKIKDPLKLNEILQRLDSNTYLNPLYVADSETKRSVMQRLIKIYNSIDAVSTNGVNKMRIVEIASIDNSPEVHAFYLSILENGPEISRKYVLRSVFFGAVNGDDIYNKIKDIQARGLAKNDEVLPALKGANPQRALKEIQQFVRTTNNPEEYVWSGMLLCGYKDADILDVIIERYDYFKSIPKVERPNHYDPSFSFDIDMLKKYIEVKEGVKLKKALEIFDDSGVFGDRKLPLLKSKIESKDAISREAVIDFLEHQMRNGSVAKEKILPILKDAQSQETNHALKLKLGKVIERNEKPAARRAGK